MARSRIDVLIRSEVARHPAFASPYGASKDESEALQARRQDFADRVVEAVGVLGSSQEVLSAVTKALGTLLAGSALPDPALVLRNVREALAAQQGPLERPPCAPCQRDGGYRTRRDGELRKPAPSVIGPRDHGGPEEPMCSTHLEEHAWKAHRDRALREGRPFPHPAPVSMR